MPERRREWWTLAVLVIGSLVLSLGPPLSRGAFGIPRNDDWVFTASLVDSVAAGQLIVDPWSSAMVWGHILWAWPIVAVVGESAAALQVGTALIGATGLVVLHRLLRRWTPAWVALTTVALTALGPLYPPLAGSYMTDVPAFALQVMALEAGARALSGQRINWAWWAGALGVALAAFTVREYSVAVLAGLVAGLLVRRPSRRELALAAGSLALWLAVAVGLFLLRVSTAPPVWTAEMDAVRPTVAQVLSTGGRGVAGLSLLVVVTAPWLLGYLITRGSTSRGRAAVAGALALAVLAFSAWFATGPFSPIRPSYVSPTPAYAETLAGTAPMWMPPWVWSAVRLGAVLTAGFLILCLVLWAVSTLSRTTLSRTNGGGGVGGAGSAAPGPAVAAAICLAFLAAGIALTTVVSSLRGYPVFDRYFLPLAPFVIAAALSLPIDVGWWRRAATAGVALLATGWGVWAVVAADTAATNDSLRWSVGRELAAMGWQPATVDAGYEWWGAHQNGQTSMGPPRPGRTFWTAMFPATPVCIQVSYSGSEDTSSTVVLTRSARTLTGTEIVVVATTADAGCASPASSPQPSL